MPVQSNTNHVERWDIFELQLSGPGDGNPFIDVELQAEFRYQNRVLVADGFYDGDGVYRIRCMPDTPGEWHYQTRSNIAALDGHSGSFTCTPATEHNHGPVYVRNRYHFAYADGTPHISIGTTCYAWAHQPEALMQQTLDTLKSAPFNKIRMCVFPKDYTYNKDEPPLYPFETQTDGSWDTSRFNPAFFRMFEGLVGQLRELNIEADLILLHPYDRWGHSQMSAEDDDRYLRYVVARLAAYRNVWWSMANEYDLLREKTLLDWDRFFQVVQAADPHQHLRSVHNCREFYDHGKPWVTHQSIQHSDLGRVRKWRELHHKPVVVDECCYEGDIPNGWGNIPAQELVHRFWLGTCLGGYVGHGETYLHPEDVLWWSKGGVLHGDSPARIAFLRDILAEMPVDALDSIDGICHRVYPCAGQDDAFYLIYTSVRQPAELSLTLPEGQQYRAEVIDTWAMTITPLDEVLSGRVTAKLPGRPFQVLRLTRLAE